MVNVPYKLVSFIIWRNCPGGTWPANETFLYSSFRKLVKCILCHPLAQKIRIWASEWTKKRLTNSIHQICMPPIVIFSVSAWLTNNKRMSLHCNATKNEPLWPERIRKQKSSDGNKKWDHFVKNGGYQFKIHKTDGWGIRNAEHF